MAIMDLFKKKIVRVDLEKVNDPALQKSLIFTVTEQKAKIADLEKQLIKYRQEEEEINEEENVKEVLDKKKKELRLAHKGTVFSTRAFWAKYFRDKKLQNALGYYNYDRSTRLANFGDIIITKKGEIGLVDDKGNLLIKMQNTRDMFQSVGALGNDISTGKIPLWLDEEGEWIENIMEYEASDVVATPDGSLKFSKARKKPVYEIIQKYNLQLAEIRSDLEEAEALNTELQNENDNLKSQLTIHEKTSETSRAETKYYEDRLVGIDKIFRRTTRDLSQSRSHQIENDDYIEQLESVVKNLREQAEREGSKLDFDRALELIQDVRSTVVNELPEAIPVTAKEDKGSTIPAAKT